MDVRGLAARLIKDTAGISLEGKDPAAVALGRKGGLKGGKARAERLTAEKRQLIARKAAEVRWARVEK